MSKEIWRQVFFKETILPFEVSNLGAVRRIPGPDAYGRNRKGYLISPQLLPNGYVQVTIKHNFKKYTPGVHALVAFAFLGAPPGEYGRGKIAVNHKNGVRSDNRPENLEWCTYQENLDHACANGRMRIGEDNPSVVLTVTKVRKIRALYKSGISKAEITRRFGCSYCAIDLVCRRETWKHV